MTHTSSSIGYAEIVPPTRRRVGEKLRAVTKSRKRSICLSAFSAAFSPPTVMLLSALQQIPLGSSRVVRLSQKRKPNTLFNTSLLFQVLRMEQPVFVGSAAGAAAHLSQCKILCSSRASGNASIGPIRAYFLQSNETAGRSILVGTPGNSGSGRSRPVV